MWDRDASPDGRFRFVQQVLHYHHNYHKFIRRDSRVVKECAETAVRVHHNVNREDITRMPCPLTQDVIANKELLGSTGYEIPH